MKGKSFLAGHYFTTKRMTESETGTSLLVLSPDDVFASRGVYEVIELHKKIEYEIERKREDLRAMVGERYREFIHAADTIGDMKLTTERTLDHLGSTVALCRNLHDTHLIGFKIQAKTRYGDRNDSRKAAHSVAVQVKILLEIPERLWCCIENENLLQATQLFILARHIHTGLQLQASNKSVAEVVSSLKPLLERQWISLSGMHHILESASRQKLQQVQLKQQESCSCLLSLHLLSPSSTLLQLLTTFMDLHSGRGLVRQLGHEAAWDAQETGRRIVDSARLVVKTIQLVQSCFVESSSECVMSRLDALYGKDTSPLIDLVQFQDSQLLKLLPPVIANYRLTVSKEMKPLTQEEVSSTIAEWIKTSRVYIHDRVKLLLSNINNAKTLHQIKEEAMKIETPANWKQICESLLMPPIDVWSEYFQPLLTSRVKEIIEMKWRVVYEAFRTQMTEDLLRVSSEGCEESEADLNWFVWKDLIGETVIESRERVVDVMNSLMKGMAHQDRGFTPTLERLCQNIDRQLAKLLADLSTYLHGNEVDRSDLADSTAERADRDEVQVYLRDITARNVANMLQFIKDECFNNPNLQKNELQRQTTAIYTARFINSLTLLLPSLKKCFVSSNTYLDPYSLKANDGLERWNEMCARLKESCIYSWDKWVDIAMVKIENMKDGLPQEFTLEANIDFLLMQWDVIQIQEKDDQEKCIESTIKIPSGPSLKLQQFIYASSRILDQVVPHTLPREVHSSFIERLSSITLAHYDRVIREKESDINQKCALQLLMDVRHATLLLVPRENKDVFDLSTQICERLRKIIDPFDYDVFYPHIQNNVKRSVQRVQTLLGDVTGSAEQLGRQLGARAAASAVSADRAPALLASAPPHDWFPLLPVTAPVRDHTQRKKQSASQAVGVASSVVTTKSTASEISELMSTSLSGAKQGAAAFFGDWFSS